MTNQAKPLFLQIYEEIESGLRANKYLFESGIKDNPWRAHFKIWRPGEEDIFIDLNLIDFDESGEVPMLTYETAQLGDNPLPGGLTTGPEKSTFEIMEQLLLPVVRFLGHDSQLDR